MPPKKTIETRRGQRVILISFAARLVRQGTLTNNAVNSVMG
ncbi:MAG: hypothetical protein ABFD10_00465 [Prolixibacteraceae bacterium]